MAARHDEKLRYEKKYIVTNYVFVCKAKDYLTMTSGGKRAPYFNREIRSGAGFKTDDFEKEKR